jgi:hypothetical protein
MSGKRAHAVPQATKPKSTAGQTPPSAQDSTFQPLPSYARDALTGAPLAKGALYMRLKAEEPTEERAVPSRIDTSKPYPVNGEGDISARRLRGGYDGGLEWSADFYRYIKDSLPASIREALRAWDEWWTVPSVRARLTEEYGLETVEAVIDLETGRRSLSRICRDLRKAPSWVIRHKARCMRIVRGDYLPHAYLKNLALLAYRLTLPELPRYDDHSHAPRYAHSARSKGTLDKPRVTRTA